jgi:poly(3-hydroxybutyrate) depolymerase
MRARSLALVAAVAAAAACSSAASTDSGPPGVGPGGPLDGGAEGEAREGGTLPDDGANGEPAVCSTDKSPGTQSVACEGLTVKLTIPSSCPPAGCGLVLDLHGALMSGDLEEAHTELRTRAGAKGYVVVQPTGPERTYANFTGPQWFNADDEALHRLVLALVRDQGIDRSRVHATGFSQGGFAVLRQMCKYADTYASIAVGAAGIDGCPLDASIIAGCPITGSSKPSRPLDVLFLFGRKDAVVPRSCAEQARDAIVQGFGLGAAQTIGSDASYARKRYEGGGVTLETLEHDYTTNPNGALALNKGHCVPGSQANTGSVWDDLACEDTSAFVWGTEIASFFEAHPRH